MVFQTLCDALQHWRSERPDAIAFYDQERPLTFAAFGRAVDQICNGLQRLNLAPASRVVQIAADQGASYALLFACARLGHVFCPLNPRLETTELWYAVSHSQAPVVFADSDSYRRLQRKLTGAEADPTMILLDGSPAASFADLAPLPVCAEEGVTVGEQACVQLYTSGTTGRPKGVVLAERSFFRLPNLMRDQGDVWMDLTSNDRLLLSLPIFHIGGMWWAVQGFVAGATGVLLPRFAGGAALAAVKQLGVTHLAMVPAMLQLTLAEPACLDTDFSKVRALLYGGSPMDPTLLQRAQACLNCDFFQIYGMTETGNMAVCLRPEDHEPGRSPHLSAGRALPGVQLQIRDQGGALVAPGDVGEVWIHSPSVMLGYYRDAAANAETLCDGWVRSGDAGFLDEDGFLTICDRYKDMIIYAGENLFPAEIEAVLLQHGAVAEAAVIGVPDPRWGETVKAFVVQQADATLSKRDLIAFATKHLADFKVPKSISFVESLPRNAAGKLLKRTLRAPFWADQLRQVN